MKILGNLTEEEARELAPSFFNEALDRLYEHCSWCVDCNFDSKPDTECRLGKFLKKLYDLGYSWSSAQYNVVDEGVHRDIHYIIVHDDWNDEYRYSTEFDASYKDRIYPTFTWSQAKSLEEVQKEVKEDIEWTIDGK